MDSGDEQDPPLPYPPPTGDNRESTLPLHYAPKPMRSDGVIASSHYAPKPPSSDMASTSTHYTRQPMSSNVASSSIDYAHRPPPLPRPWSTARQGNTSPYQQSPPLTGFSNTSSTPALYSTASASSAYPGAAEDISVEKQQSSWSNAQDPDWPERELLQPSSNEQEQQSLGGLPAVKNFSRPFPNTPTQGHLPPPPPGFPPKPIKAESSSAYVPKSMLPGYLAPDPDLTVTIIFVASYIRAPHPDFPKRQINIPAPLPAMFSARFADDFDFTPLHVPDHLAMLAAEWEPPAGAYELGPYSNWPDSAVGRWLAPEHRRAVAAGRLVDANEVGKVLRHWVEWMVRAEGRLRFVFSGEPMGTPRWGLVWAELEEMRYRIRPVRKVLRITLEEQDFESEEGLDRAYMRLFKETHGTYEYD